MENGECGEIGRVVAAPEIRVLVGGARQPEVDDVHEQDPKQGCAPQHVQCEQAILGCNRCIRRRVILWHARIIAADGSRGGENRRHYSL